MSLDNKEGALSLCARILVSAPGFSCQDKGPGHILLLSWSSPLSQHTVSSFFSYFSLFYFENK